MRRTPGREAASGRQSGDSMCFLPRRCRCCEGTPLPNSSEVADVRGRGISWHQGTRRSRILTASALQLTASAPQLICTWVREKSRTQETVRGRGGDSAPPEPREPQWDVAARGWRPCRRRGTSVPVQSILFTGVSRFTTSLPLICRHGTRPWCATPLCRKTWCSLGTHAARCH